MSTSSRTGIRHDLAGIRRANLERTLLAILESPGLSQGEIAAVTGLATGAVSSLVNQLVDAEILTDVAPERTTGRGRPRRSLELADHRPDLVGVTITRSRIEAKATTLQGRELGRTERAFEHPVDAATAAEVIADAVSEVTATHDTDRPRIAIAFPGGRRSGRLISSPLGWEGVRVDDLVSPTVLRGYARPRVGNDGSYATLAEHAEGAARGHRNAVVFLLTRGLGGSAIIDGRLLLRAEDAPGFGHTPLDPAGESCSCGLRGCAELSLSLFHLAAKLGEVDLLEQRGPGGYADDLARRAADEDARVAAVLETARDTMDRLGSIVAALLNPELIVLAGEGAALAPWITPATVGSERVPLTAGATGGETVMLGALVAARRAFFADPLAHGG